MKKIFILCLTKHFKWGYVLAPYMAEIIPGKDYLLTYDRITTDNISKYASKLTDIQRKLVQWIEQYSEQELARVLRRKTNAREFMQSLTDEMISKEIRPYIERRLLHCFDLLPASETRIFIKEIPERVYLEHEIIYDNQPAEAVFNFHYRPEEGSRYFLSVFHNNQTINLLGKRLIALVNQPSIMVLNDRLLRFKDIDSKKLIPFTGKEYISVPKQVEEKYFNTFVVDSIRKYRVHTDGFTLIDEPSDPIPVISLENDLRYRPVLILRFDYGSGRKLFNAGQSLETEAISSKGEGQYIVKRFKRNRDVENECVSFLCQLGFYNTGGPMFYNDEASANTTDTDSQQCMADLVEKLNTLSDTLSLRGFRIDQKFFTQKYFTGSVKLEMKLATDHDWFDVHAVVHFGGFKIPFISFRDHIIRQDRNYLLPNGEIMILPAEWLAKYTQVMLMADQHTDSLRISKRYFTLVNDTFEGMDEKYRNSMMALCHTGELEVNYVPASVHATLRPYQLQGVNWMHTLHDHKFGGCLADDMGLGKTLQTLSLLQFILVNEQETAGSSIQESPDIITTTQKEAQYVQLSLFDAPAPKSDQLPATGNGTSAANLPTCNMQPATSLVVMPASLIHNWANETARFTPHLKVLRYTGTDRRNLVNFKKYHLVLTSYGILRNDIDILSKYNFLYLILDEAQYIKNPESVTYQAALQINASYFLSLSGTPVENSLTDLWAQMNFLNRGLLGNLNFFKEHFANPIEKYNDENSRRKLQRLVQPFLLRRTKQEVAPELPALTEQVRYCEMTDAQRSLYEEEKSKARNEIIEHIDEHGVNKSGILIFRALNRLRQLAIHPAMLDKDYTFDSGKFDQITETLNNLHSEGHKALLFSSFTKHLNLVANHLQQQNISYAMLTGQTRNREETIHRFNNQPDVPFFLISLKAGGVGLNLTAADYVFLLDPWWNPAAEQQAISRTHRIGQSNKVFAYRMITSDTIEEKILQLQEKKSNLADILARSDNPFHNMTPESVMELFV